MGENSERRRSPRYPCSGSAEILQDGRRWGWGKVSDISRGGCYIETANPLPIGAAEAQLRLTISDVLVEMGAKAVSITPLVGMGMEFVTVSQEQESKLAKIVRSITGESPTTQQVENSHPSATAIQITREAAPGILAKVIKQINEKGILTRQDFIDILKANK